jgi:hypothetical protein
VLIVALFTGGSAFALPISFERIITAELHIPEDVKTANTWYGADHEELDEYYALLVTGGTGIGYVWFSGDVMGVDYNTSNTGEQFGIHTHVLAPFALSPSTFPGGGWGGHGPNSCYGSGCWPYLEFTYGEPQTFRVHMSADVDYSYYRGCCYPDPSYSGRTLTGTASLRMLGVNNFDDNLGWIENPDAVISISGVPEPGTAAGTTAAVLGIIMLCRRKKHL